MGKIRLIYYTDKLYGILEGEDPKRLENLYFNNGHIDLKINALFFSAMMYNSTKSRYLKFEKQRIINLTSGLSNRRRMEIAKKIIKVIIPKVEFDMIDEKSVVRIPLVDFLLIMNIKDINVAYNINNGAVVLYPTNMVYMATDLYISFLKYTAMIKRSEIIQNILTSNVRDYFMKVYNIESITLRRFPPCIETIINEGVSEGQRNNALFSLLSFFKYLRINYDINISDSEIIEYVNKANSNFNPPLPSKDVNYIITYHLYGSGKEKVYNFCGFIRKTLPNLCTSTPKQCWRIMFSKKTKRDKKRN